MHDIIVIGGSAGGVQALQVLTAALPLDLQASLFVTLHIGNGDDGMSHLAEILNRVTRVTAKFPPDGETIERGKIYIAPPDHHLLVAEGHIHLSHGPKENHHRPAINPLFRSAATAYGSRVIGVVLTGMLDDGTAGLAEIKRRGGVAVVQDPSDAMFPSMPANAIRYVEADHVVPLKEIAPLLARLAVTRRVAVVREEPMETTKTAITCPECRGPLWQEKQGEIVEFRCRVGHTYSPLSLAQEHDETLERTLWSTMVTLEEAADIDDCLVPELGEEIATRAKRRREQAGVIKAMLEEDEIAKKPGL